MTIRAYLSRDQQQEAERRFCQIFENALSEKGMRLHAETDRHYLALDREFSEEERQRLKDLGVVSVYLQRTPIPGTNSINGYVTVLARNSTAICTYDNDTEETTYSSPAFRGEDGEMYKTLGFDTLQMFDRDRYGDREVSTKIPVENLVDDIVQRTKRYALGPYAHMHEEAC